MVQFSSLLYTVLAATLASAAPTPFLKTLVSGIAENFKEEQILPFNASLLPDLEYYAQYAAASYCDPTNRAGIEIGCRDGICPLVTAASSMTTAVFRDTLITDTTGFVARDDTRRAITIVFRGSTSTRNWIGNAIMTMEGVPYCKGCSMHSGFLHGMEESMEIVDGALNALQRSHPGYKIVVVGHSLGGALASVTTARLRAKGLKVRLFSYGAPRVGNVKLSEYIGQSGETYRVTRLDDPVTKVPPTLIGYGSIQPEYHIKTEALKVKPKDIEVILDASKDLDSDSTDFDQHRYYFGPTKMTACKSGEKEF